MMTTEQRNLASGISVMSTDRVNGLWVSREKGVIGLVEEEGANGGYLVIWKDQAQFKGLPLAITATGIQLPTDDHSQKFIDWDTLWEVVEAFKTHRAACKNPTESQALPSPQ